MRLSYSPILIFVLSLLFFASDAMAQWTSHTGGRFRTESGFFTDQIITIPVRAGGHEDFSRMVFDWPFEVDYEINEIRDGVLDIQFQRRALVDTTEVRDAPETNFGKIDVVSGLGQHLRVRVLIPEKADYKAYRLGFKIVIDVSDVPGQARGEGLPRNVELPKQIAVEASEDAIEPADTLERQNPVAPITVFEPIIFDWTSTRNFDVAAFKHHDAIYLVTDRMDVKFSPVIRQGQGEVLLEPIPTKEAQVYRAILSDIVPDDATILVEGGDLAWRISIVTPDQNQTVRGDDPRNNVTLNTSGDKDSIELQLPFLQDKLSFFDPRSGETYTVILAADNRAYNPHFFSTPFLSLLESGVGLGIIERSDALNIELAGDHVKISDAQDLFFSAHSKLENVAPIQPNDNAEQNEQATEPAAITAPENAQINDIERPPLSGKRIFFFDRWKLDLPDDYTQARQELESELNKASAQDKPEIMLKLAKFLLANEFAAEASGYLDLASVQVPALEADPEFRALRGAAFALMGSPYEALQYLDVRSLDNIGEIDMWRAVSFALAYQWEEAKKILPSDTPHIYYYTPDIRAKLGLVIAEIYLRNENVDKALEIMDLVAKSSDKINARYNAGLAYLRGEAKRATGDNVAAVEFWNEAANSNDQLFRVKALLSRTILQLRERAITPEKAIEELEKLRFAWRGDGLETQIARALGRLYLTQGEWEKAFDLMRNAAGFARGSEEGRAITAAMTQSFAQLFTNPPEQLTALDAVSLYDRFPELTPAGAEGRSVLRGLVGFLLDIDLLDRAASTYETLLGMDGNQIEQLNDALQLAAIYVLSLEPEKALDVLEGPFVKDIEADETQARTRTLLRAKALSDLERYDDALALLDGVTPARDSLSLAVDIAWAAQNWGRAGNETARLLTLTDLDADILDDEQKTLILNYAVALKLDTQAENLGRLRTRFLDKFPRGSERNQFEVITRPSETVTLADRQTLLNIVSQVDLFESFLEPKTAE